MDKTAQLGARIAKARRARGLSQEQLAAQVEGLEKTKVSKIESGLRKVSSVELADIAETLGVSIKSLLGVQQRSSLLEVAARLDDGDVTDGAQQAIERARELLETDHLLTQLDYTRVSTSEATLEKIRATLSIKHPSSDQNAKKQGREAAEQVREHFDLGSQPIVDFALFMETEFGIDVAMQPLPDGVSGLCVRDGGVFIALVNTSSYYGHQRFTLAHELAHYIFDDFVDGKRFVTDEDLKEQNEVIEVRANAFAAYLLVPSAVIHRRSEGSLLSDVTLAQLLVEYDVSLPCLVRRLEEEKKLTPTEYERLRSTLSEQFLTKHGFGLEVELNEKRKGRTQPPSSIYQRAMTAYADGRTGIGLLANMLRSNDEEQLRSELESAGVTVKKTPIEDSALF